MRFLMNRRLHINMGNYEHIEDTATVEVDTIADAEELTANGVTTSLDDIRDFMHERLEALLWDGIVDAATFTDKDESFILPYEEERRPNNKSKTREKRN